MSRKTFFVYGKWNSSDSIRKYSLESNFKQPKLESSKINDCSLNSNQIPHRQDLNEQ